jgi:hypothetical protein
MNLYRLTLQLQIFFAVELGDHKMAAAVTSLFTNHAQDAAVSRKGRLPVGGGGGG